MKTPKREYYFYDSGINPDNGDIIRDAVTPELYETRWKRKNRVKQLKRTIARLTDALTAERKQFNALLLGDHLKRYSPLKKTQPMTTERILYFIAFIGINLASMASIYYQGVARGLDQAIRILKDPSRKNNQ